MNKPHSQLLFLLLSLLCVVFTSHLAVAELSLNLVGDPKSGGVAVYVDEPALDGGLLATVRLTVENRSTNVLTIDPARSSFTAPDGQTRQFAAITGSDFALTLLPGQEASSTIETQAALQEGAQMKVFLYWTLGAVVNSATWVWEISGVAVPAAPPSEVPAGMPAEAASEVTVNDYVLGTLAVAAGIGLLVLIGWGLWSLVALLW